MVAVHSTNPKRPPPLRALEFYSGIGGMHYALRSVDPDAQVLHAFEQNHKANDVYGYNFGTRPKECNIEGLSPSLLDALPADLWMMSPPCQPYTRRGLQRGSQDKRAASFPQLLKYLQAMQAPPRLLLLENVVGFETSETRDEALHTLRRAGFQVQEFILSPTQFGVPYSRPRYFLLAKRPSSGGDSGVADISGGGLGGGDNCTGGLFAAEVPAEQQPIRVPPSALLLKGAGGCAGGGAGETAAAEAQAAGGGAGGGAGQAAAAQAEAVAGWHPPPVLPLAEFLEQRASPCTKGVAAAAAGAGPEAGAGMEVMHERNADNDPFAKYRLPGKLLGHNCDVLDVVDPRSTDCNCFTKSYYKFLRGSGSVLATTNLHLMPTVQSLWERQHAMWERGQQQQPVAVTAGTAANSTTSPSPCSKKRAAAEACSSDAAPCTGRDTASGQPGAAQLPAEAAGGGNTGSYGTVVGQSQQPQQQQGQGEGDDEQERKQLRGQLLDALQQLDLRYFTPREVANLHSFPPDFGFPDDISLKNRYALLGNSLSCVVVAELLRYLLTDPPAITPVPPPAAGGAAATNAAPLQTAGGAAAAATGG